MMQIARGSMRARIGLAAVLGALAALGLAPFGVWPLTLVALLFVPALLIAARTPWQATWTGWAFGTGYFAVGMVWIIEPFLVDVARYGWMAPFALVFLSAGLALFWAAAFGVASALGQSPTGKTLLLVCTWSLAELARAYVLTGLPWGALAQIWTDTPVILMLAWIGPQGVAVLTLMVVLPLGLMAQPTVPPLTRLVFVAPAVICAGLVVAADRARNTVTFTDATVRLIQPNAPQAEKWDPDLIPMFFQRQVDFTAAGPRPDLIVWPETAVPALLNYAEPAFEVITEAAAGTPVVLGIQRREAARLFNAMVYIDGSGSVAETYDKHHLVPFGEYFPFGDVAARFGLRGFAAQDGDGYSSGPGAQLMPMGALGNAVPLICYEAVFPQDVSAAPGRGDFLLQITNDAWFGDWSGPYQHLAQARMRAVEQGLPMIRVANTGVSAMIDPLGQITHSIPLGETGFVDAVLPAPLAKTLYALTGDFPVLMILLTALLGLTVLQRRHRSGN